LVDQALMAHVVDALAASGGVDPTGTAAVASLAGLREECRGAKERLSTQEATDLDAQLPDRRTAVRVTRDELETLIAVPLAGVLDALDNTLQRNRIGWPDVAALVATGGGAAMPLVERRLSEHSGMSVLTTAVPGLDAARGAAVVGAYTSAAEARTGLSPVASPDAPTGLAPAASP
ncbi:UNVERIFIED_CONTAM: Hsp70 family protein, partial [Bacillus amyloliquefaciens DSM 7 = ATCC 23350]